MKEISTLDNLRNRSKNNPLRAVQTIRDMAEMNSNKNTEADDLAEMSLDGSEIDLNASLPTEDSTSSEPTDTGFTGMFLSVTGKEFDGEVYNLGGVNAGELQFGVSQTTGKALAGAGAVVLSSDGIELLASNTSPLSFVDTDGNQLVTILNGGNSDPVTSEPDLIITALQKAGKDSSITIEAYTPAGQTPYVVLSARESGEAATQLALQGQSIVLNFTGGDVDTRIESDGNANAVFVDAGNNRVGIMNGSPAVALDVTGAITASSNITSNSFFNMGATNAQTIASGVITVTGGRCVVDTQGGAATDDLDTINGGADGDILVIYTANSARDVTAKDGTGNLALAGDFVMTNIRDRLVLLKDSGTWVELSRSDNQ